MAKSVHNDVLDAALNYLVDTADEVFVCSAEPTTYAEAQTTYALAEKLVQNFSAQAPADGDVSGRKVAIPEVSIASIDTSGTATHVALCDNSGSTLLYVTEITSQVLPATNPLTVPTWDVELRDPA